jgi:glutamyl-tRNA synthetase
LNELAASLQAGLGKIAQPVRVAVTGTAVSPPIDATLALLGRERTLGRLDAVAAKPAAL